MLQQQESQFQNEQNNQELQTPSQDMIFISVLDKLSK